MRLAALFFLLLYPALAPGGPAASSQATTAPTSLLQQLDVEVRTAYQNTVQGVVRVHLPASVLNPAADVLRKWERQLTPDVRNRLRNDRLASPSATSHPTDAQGDDAEAITIGLVLNNQGVLLVPFFIDPARLNGSIRITTRQGDAVQARILGADHSTGVTVLRCDQPVGRPVKIARVRPTEGTLLVAIWGDESRLMVWTGSGRESGVVIMPDGSVGVLRGGRFLGGPGYEKLATDLIDSGEVHRAKLGLMVGELPPQQHERLNRLRIVDRPGLIVTKVTPDSPASRADVRAGDILVSINGYAVPDLTAIAAVLTEARGKASVVLGRDDQKVEVTVELEK
jgi:hypothetical protein